MCVYQVYLSTQSILKTMKLILSITEVIIECILLISYDHYMEQEYQITLISSFTCLYDYI